MESDLILVHGLFASQETLSGGALSRVCASRAKAVAEQGEAVGVRDYECVEGSGKAFANRMLRLARGTAPAVDAVEIIELDEEAVLASLAEDAARQCWQQMLGCATDGLDPRRSFILAGKTRWLARGPATGQRVLWFGCGLSQLSEAEFIAHYTGQHGPLVAGYGEALGLRRYRQVPSEQGTLCDALRELGLGQAQPPPVFAELFMGRPPFDLASLRTRRQANREIKADEKRHIDFARSMLLLA